MKHKTFTYTKTSGESSDRHAVVMSEPRKNYLMIDLSLLNSDEKEEVLATMQEIEEFRNSRMAEISDLVHWRTFKPEGIEWQ